MAEDVTGDPTGASPDGSSPEPKKPEKTRSPDAPRGLQAIQGAREARKKRKWPPAKVAFWFLLFVSVATVLYWYRMSANTEKERQKLMADQRAVDGTVGKSWYPMRDAIEKLTVEAPSLPTDDFVAPDIGDFAFRKKAGVYLRLRVDQAASAESIRAASDRSLHDGFTSCLMQTVGDDPLAGKVCTTARECEEGQICNEFDHCAKPTQPINLRMAYRTMRILSPDWVREVQDGDDLRLRALRATFDDAIKTDMPIAVELVTSAKSFVLVLDERPPPPKDEPADAGASAEDLELAAGKHYPSRVFIYRLEDSKLMLHIKRDPSGQLLGAPTLNDPKSQAGILRQARGCELGNEVKAKLPAEK
ncbi:MAG: hypothetical protein U0414_39275 [Polyangiaceae bacterium]